MGNVTHICRFCIGTLGKSLQSNLAVLHPNGLSKPSPAIKFEIYESFSLMTGLFVGLEESELLLSLWQT